MSDCARNRFNEKEDFQLVLGKGNPGESSFQQHTNWMAHWTRASSSAYGKSCSPLDDANNSTCTKDFETSLFELKNSSMTERLMLGGNCEGISMEQLNSSMWGMPRAVWQETELTRIERRDGSFQSSVIQMQKDENFYAKRVVSETLSVCRLSDLPLDLLKLVSSDENPDSHLNQLPMLSFSQKLDSILGRKRKYATGTVFDDHFVPQQIPKLNVGPSNLMACSHQEFELQFPRMTDMVMDHCKASGGIKYLLEDPTCLISDHAVKKLKVYSNSSSDCGMDEQGTGHYFANPNQEPLGRCGEKQFNLSENSGKFTESVKQKGPCLFEMLTMPSKSQSTYPIDSLSSCSPLFGAQNQFSPKTKTVHGDAQYATKSSAGIASSSLQKDNDCAAKANEQLATLSIQGSPRYNKESRFHNANANQYVSSKAITSSKQELSTLGTEIMDLDPLPFQSCTRNQVGNDTIRSPEGADPSDKWLERLLHDTTDPHVHRSKRPRTRDCRPVGGAGGMSDTDITDHVEARCVPVCRLSDLPLDLLKLVSSDENPDSHLNQLPMLSFSQKHDSILGQNRKYATGTVFDDLFVPQQIPKLNVGPSNLMACSHQEFELQFPRMTDMVMDHCKAPGGIKYLLEDPTCLISDHAVKKLKVYSNSSSDCGMDEQGTGHYFANPNQEPLGRCGEKQFNLSEDSGKFTESVKQKGPCLFEMLTMPSKSQSTYPIDSLSSCSPLFGAQNQFSPKTKTVHGDAQYATKSSAGIASSSLQKDNDCAAKANEQLATLSIQGSPRYNKESRFHNANANQYVSSKAITSSKQELSTLGTEIMDLDPLPFQSCTRNQVGNDTIRSPEGADPSDKWLERLLHDTTDPHVHRSKRPRTRDCRPVGGAGGMSDTDITDHVEARCVHCWIGRLCQGGGAPVSHGEPDERRTAAKPDVAAREFGGHFPSIKAMAMMGRVLSKIRQFDRERKGPWVMWKAEDAA